VVSYRFLTSSAPLLEGEILGSDIDLITASWFRTSVVNVIICMLAVS
jgi:hypothetical protein